MHQRATHLRTARHLHYDVSKLRDVHALSNSQLNKVFKENMLVDDAHHVMFCYVAKAGSTSYKSILIEQNALYKATYGNGSVMDQVNTLKKKLYRLL